MNSLKLVSFLLASLVSSFAFASTEDSIEIIGSVHAQYTLPDCSAAQIAIFNGASFDGNVYLHETDVKLPASATRTVRALAAQGETPAVCAVNGAAFVTVVTK